VQREREEEGRDLTPEKQTPIGSRRIRKILFDEDM